MTTVDLSALGTGHGGIHIAQTITSAWVEAAVRDPHGGKRWIIYDEGWSMFESAPLLARMREQWKLSRAWGLSNWLIAHRATDIDAAGEQVGCVKKAEQYLVFLLVVMLLRLPGGRGGRPRLGPGCGTPGMSADVSGCRTPRYIP